MNEGIHTHTHIHTYIYIYIYINKLITLISKINMNK